MNEVNEAVNEVMSKIKFPDLKKSLNIKWVISGVGIDNDVFPTFEEAIDEIEKVRKGDERFIIYTDEKHISGVNIPDYITISFR